MNQLETDNDSNENTANYTISLPCFDTWEMSPSYMAVNQASQTGSYFSSLNYKHMHASTHTRTHTQVCNILKIFLCALQRIENIDYWLCHVSPFIHRHIRME